MAGPAWKYFTTQEQWKAYLQDLVSTNTNACLKAITCIDNWQTEPERQQGESTEENGVGWTKYDAKEMGQLASKIRNGQALTDGELAKAKNKMKKYWKQLMQISKRQMEQQEAEEQAKLEQEAREVAEQKRQQFEEALEVLRKCGEEGIACEYGICDECPLTRGYQLRLSLGGNEQCD